MTMVRVESGGPETAQAKRLRLLRWAYTGDNQAAFAKNYAKIITSRWNNFERGFPLSKAVAFTLVHNIPGLSLDWLWHGERRGLTADVLTRLDEMEAVLEREERRS